MTDYTSHRGPALPDDEGEALWNSLTPAPLTEAQRSRLIDAARRGSDRRQGIRHVVAAIVNGAVARARNGEEVLALDVADRIVAAIRQADEDPLF